MDPTAGKMIFVVGNSRSGTTMLGRILGLNSDIHTFGELHFFEQLIGIEEFSTNPAWPSDKATSVVEKLITRARDGFFASFVPGRYENDARKIIEHAPSLKPVDLYATFLSQETQRAGCRVPCEQTPRYLFSVREILRAYPNARVINMVRDPRDVLLSQRSKWKRRFLGGSSIPMREAIRAWCNYHPWLVSRLWVSCVEYAQEINHDRFMSIRFEDILINPDHEIRKLCDFLGLPFEADMLNAPQIGSSSGLDSPDKIGINKERAGGWKKNGMPRDDRLLCEWVCRDQMKHLEYGDVLDEGRFSPRSLISMMTLPFKLSLAFTFNIKRFPNLASSLKRRLFVKRKVI